MEVRQSEQFVICPLDDIGTDNQVTHSPFPVLGTKAGIHINVHQRENELRPDKAAELPDFGEVGDLCNGAHRSDLVGAGNLIPLMAVELTGMIITDGLFHEPTRKSDGILKA